MTAQARDALRAIDLSGDLEGWADQLSARAVEARVIVADEELVIARHSLGVIMEMIS